MSVFGVDLGSRNCVVGVTRGGIDIVCNEVSKRETASYVSLGDDLRQIGENGLDKAVRAANNTVTNLKRFIGIRKGDPRLARELEFVHVPTTFDSEDRLQFEMEYMGETKALYPEQLLAMLLGKLRSYVAIETKNDIKNIRDCVISVPAYYCAEQRKLVMQACEIAGLNAMSVINENTAALVDYGIFRNAELPATVEEAQYVALVDIGYGGTTVSVAKFWHGNVIVLATSCAEDLGTRDIDFELMKYFAVEIQKKYKIDVLSSRRPMMRLLQACEKVKNMLSANFLAPLNIECIMDVDVNFNDFNRDKLDVILAPLNERLEKLLATAIAAAGIEKEKVQIAEMIGGGCRVPAFKNVVQTFFGVGPRFTLNASECIARGCTVTAAVFSPHMRVREFFVNEKPLAPICLGLKADEAPMTSSVSFLPEVNYVRTVLRESDVYPKTEEVVIANQKTSFDANLFYDEHHEGATASVRGRYKISSYSVGIPSRPLTGEVTVVVKVHASGLATIEGAYGSESYEVEETVIPEGEDAATAEPQKVVKTKFRKVALVVSAKVNVLGLPVETVAAAIAEEQKMADRDNEIQKTREVKNALESYVFENRSRICESSGMLHDYVLPEQRAKFAELATQYEEWLYDEGADAAIGEYTSRLANLREIGEPAFNRHKVRDDMPFFVSQFEKDMLKHVEKLNAAKGKQAHITDADLDVVSAMVVKASINWAKSQLEAMKEVPKTEEPTFTKAQLDNKAKDVLTAVIGVLTKKPPPPPPAADAAAPSKKDEMD